MLIYTQAVTAVDCAALCQQEDHPYDGTKLSGKSHGLTNMYLMYVLGKSHVLTNMFLMYVLGKSHVLTNMFLMYVLGKSHAASQAFNRASLLKPRFVAS